MKHKLHKCLLAFILMLPCYSETRITNEIINDYLDMAHLYQDNHKYETALEYITMIEPYDEFNPTMIYQKVYLLKSLNYIGLAEKELEKLVLLNHEYVCSDLAVSIYKELDIKDMCSIKN